MVRMYFVKGEVYGEGRMKMGELGGLEDRV